MDRLSEQKVCIVGLGLMGGSLALALQGHVAEVTGIETDAGRRTMARERGIVLTADDDHALAAKADIVILATPLRTLPALVEQIGSVMQSGALMLDLGSVKGPVVAAMNNLPDHLRAVSMHPMGGQADADLSYADANLFREIPFVVCETRRTEPYAETKQLVGELLEAVGGRQIVMDADQHDRMAAATRQLPYALAAALALYAGQRADDEGVMWSLAEAGFGDTSRLATNDPAAMTDILLENAHALAASLDVAQAALTRIRHLAEEGRADDLRTLLEKAQAARRNWEEGMDR